MSNGESHHVTVELKDGYQFLVHFDDVNDHNAAPALLCDEPPPLGEGKGPSPASVLGAAVGNCLAASLAYGMRKARIEPSGLRASVTTHVARNPRGRLRIVNIDVELSADIAQSGFGRAERCMEIFEDFCTVTASIRHGIPVSVTLKQDAPAQA